MTLGPAVPALPVSDTAAATLCYRERLGFAVVHADPGFVIVRRDGCVLHLWLADDHSWQGREDLATRPVRSGAESFLAGTASCRIPVADGSALRALYEELHQAEMLHPTSRNGVLATDYGTDEVHVLDSDGNLLSFYSQR